MCVPKTVHFFEKLKSSMTTESIDLPKYCVFTTTGLCFSYTDFITYILNCWKMHTVTKLVLFLCILGMPGFISFNCHLFFASYYTFFIVPHTEGIKNTKSTNFAFVYFFSCWAFLPTVLIMKTTFLSWFFYQL